MINLEKCSDKQNVIRNTKINVLIPYLKELMAHKAEIQSIKKTDSVNRYFLLPSGYELELTFGICAAVQSIIMWQKKPWDEKVEDADYNRQIYNSIATEIKDYFQSWKYFEGYVGSPIGGGITKYMYYIDNKLNQYGSCAYGQLRWNLIKYVCEQLELSIYGLEK